MLGKNDSVTESYPSMKFKYPFDESLQIHLEYDGYNGEIIKQADVILIGFPFNFPMDEQVRLNDIVYYTNRTDNSGPAMTWGLTAIAYLEFGTKYEFIAELLFVKSYRSYIRYPFFIWYETPTGGTSNFLTGAGGFLQGMPFGYGGIRIHETYLSFSNFNVAPYGVDKFSFNELQC